MSRKSAIVAVGQTDYAAKRLDVSIPEMVRESVDRAFASKDLDFSKIDAVVVGNMELFEGINMPEQWMVAALGGAGKPIYKLNTGGTVGASVAVMCDYLVKSGLHDVVVGIGYQKQSEGETQSAITTVGDPTWERSVMAGAIGNFAVMASTYVRMSGVTPEQAAMAAVKARGNACLNPHAHLQIPDLTIEKVVNSRVLAEPVRLLDMCPQSDGACTAIFAAEGIAEKLTPQPAWVAATATAHDQQFMGDSPARLAQMRSLQTASQTVYDKVGIKDPRKELDVAELYEPATYAELAMTENVRLCGRGEGGILIESGATQMDGDIPVNPSGGVLATNPVGATAMIRVAEAALQVMDEAGEHQIPNAATALATGYGGNAWTEALILKRDRG
ncbi:MAG: thiolase family protein [Actinobacteria bacterium]|nr:thiolase family protein [Actinomycetota bacterium]NIS36538.1 thiolase family protein [Actinomycetota bacterium]NIU22388.1 thiolase family protein [Actinomycetota bacterium]NIU71049.1 thiolase family protein [Actinomycetota bacterium]NIV90548.1 thiolase family protein [Actinomycetota bacterium]